MAISAVQVIERKRDGHALTSDEIRALVGGFTSGAIPDYQMSAFAMAVYFAGMDARETADLTRAMADSGERFAFPDDAPTIVDKHSTGGVGDKVSLILAPLLACNHLWVPMISGRGLGITGGTLDKLESIPHFDVRLSLQGALQQLRAIGVVMIGQTDSICPADRKLYALRDVTATVPSQPLIVSSIMSKKIAESLDRLVLDVKFGSGAFMKTRSSAQSLADGLAAVAAEVGLAIHTVLTPMDEPLGAAVGNSLEVQEALECLDGGGPADLRQLVLTLAEKVADAPRHTLERWLDDGTARRKFDALCAAQGGDLDAFAQRDPAPVIRELAARHSGTVTRVDALAVGTAAAALGAGRQRSADRIDPAVGFDQIVKSGTALRSGDTLLRIHARDPESAAAAAAHLRDAIRIR
ncbi:thymidine phosphorylase [soil metagenome]